MASKITSLALVVGTTMAMALGRREVSCPWPKQICDDPELFTACYEVCCLERIWGPVVGGCDKGFYCYADLDSWNCCPDGETCIGLPPPCADAVATFTSSVNEQFTSICPQSAPICTLLPGTTYNCTGDYQDYLTMSSSIFATRVTTTTTASVPTDTEIYYPTYNTFNSSIPSTHYQPPTSEPEPTYGPGPTYEPKPTYGPGPTYEPEPTYGPEPTYEPEPTYGPGPTYEPEPTYGPGPTYEPEPTYGPSPTYTPPPYRSSSSEEPEPGTSSKYTPPYSQPSYTPSYNPPPPAETTTTVEPPYTPPAPGETSSNIPPPPAYTGDASALAPKFGLIVFIVGLLLV